jgi:hypothetical protein
MMIAVSVVGLAALLGPGACKAAKIDTGRSGTYDSGSWEYVYEISAKGTRSERRFGKLAFEGWPVTKLMKVKLYDRVRTPWGVMQYFGEKGSYNAGWLAKMTYDEPLWDKGRLLPAPKAGAALEAKKRPLEVTLDQSVKTIAALDSQTIRLLIRGNARPGFAWSFRKLKGDSVTPQGELEHKQLEGLDGRVGAFFVATFKAARPGRTTYVMEYRRPGEKGDPARVIVLHFEIKPDGLAYPEPSALPGEP